MTTETARQCLVDTCDVDNARRLVGLSYCDHRLRVRGAGDRFHALQYEVALGQLALHQLQYGSDVEIDATPLNSWVLVSMPIRGRLTLCSDGNRYAVGPGEPIAIDSDHEFSLHWEGGCLLSTVRLSRQAVAAALEDSGFAPGETIRLQPLSEGSGSNARAWQSLIDFLENEARLPSAVTASQPMAARVEQLVADVVVRNHHADDQPTRHTPTSPPPTRVVRRSLEFMRAHADEALRISDIAAAAGASVRTLQENFRSQLDTTPTTALRNIRLERVRHELLLTDRAAQRTVADIAFDHGFVNLGRFARSYRAAFGELPSETLDR